MKTKEPIFNKADIILAAALLVLGLLGVFLLRGDSGETVRATVDGEAYGSWPLSVNLTLRIESDHGYNIMEIKDGQVSVTESDCPGHDCMEYGTISREGQMIVCLPHRLTITIEGGDSIDAISY